MAEELRTLSEAAGYGGTNRGPGVNIPSYDGEDWHQDADRALNRLAEVAAYAAAGEVYKDDSGELVFGVRAGKFIDGDTAYTFAGATGNLTDDATNYIFLDVDDLAAGNTVTVNQTGFPDPSTTPHIPLATIVAADGAYIIDNIDNSYRERALLGMLSAATAANLNTLVGGSASNADALHVHEVTSAMLAAAVQDLMPTLTVTATDNADGSADVTIQAKDAAGNNLAANHRVRTWATTSGLWVLTGTPTYGVAGDGQLLNEHTTGQDIDVITSAAGLLEMSLTGADGTWYVLAEIDGRIYSGSVAITGN